MPTEPTPPVTTGSPSATSASAAPAPSARPTGSGSDWPAQATETIVGLVDSAREKTTGPATKIVRTVVWGLLAAIVGTAALVLFLALLVRGFDILAQLLLDLANIERSGRSVWIAHLLTGLMFVLPGAWAMRRGAQPAKA